MIMKDLEAGPGGPAAPLGHPAWKSEIDLRQIRAFLALLAHGSVGRAAAALGLAQSTVSEALAALDRAVGAPTIHRRRGARAAVLTPVGEALLPHARRMLETLDAAHLDIADATRQVRARLRIMTNESVSTYLLPRPLRAVRGHWPNLSLGVLIGTCPEIREGVATGRCDLGVLLEPELPGEVPPNGPAGRQVMASGVSLVIFSAPGHPLARDGAPVRRDQLASFPIAVTDASGDFHQLVVQYLTHGGLPLSHLEATGTVEGVRRLVAEDDRALGILPGYALAEDLRSGRVRALAVRPRLPDMRLLALFPHVAVHHPAMTGLVERLRGRLESEPFTG